MHDWANLADKCVVTVFSIYIHEDGYRHVGARLFAGDSSVYPR